MKSFLIFFLMTVHIAFCQNNVHSFSAGGLLGNSRFMGQPFGFRGSGGIDNNGGFYLGYNLKFKNNSISIDLCQQNVKLKGITDAIDFPDAPFGVPGYYASETSRFHYCQINFQKSKNIFHNLLINYGLSSNVNLYSYSRLIIGDERGVNYIDFAKGVIMNQGEAGWFSKDYVPKPAFATVNISGGFSYIINRISLNTNYNFPLLSAIRNSKNGFYQHNLNLGLAYQITK